MLTVVSLTDGQESVMGEAEAKVGEDKGEIKGFYRNFSFFLLIWNEMNMFHPDLAETSPPR